MKKIFRGLKIIIFCFGFVDFLFWLGFLFSLIISLEDRGNGDFMSWWWNLNSENFILGILGGICCVSFVIFLIKEDEKKVKSKDYEKFANFVFKLF